ncbi:MAG TPA: methyltransferase domain-containing protein [Burkholderiaceae bacterium]|nr:methyltransferase domain-containing protein [Burkholderiaceae bacterium]
MSQLPDIHLCIVQPLGYVHSLGFIDPARYFRHQFRRFGARVSMAKNRLRHDAVNFVFGAHLGFDPAQRERHACVFVNLEQLGKGGAKVSQAYLDLLAGSAVVDYDADNVAAYAKDVDAVPVVPMLYAPYLTDAAAIPLAQRPIDLLFIGSMNPRRSALIDRVEAQGVQVAMFDSALYGEERDHFITQAKAVLNMHFYDSSRFEQVRVSHCLSLGTPVISERGAACRPHAAFDGCVHWFDECSLERVLAEFKGADFADRSQAALERFRGADPVEAYGDLLAFAAGFGRAHHERRPQAPWRPTRIHIGSGKDYKPGWLNVDVLARAEPDLVLDLSQPLQLPLAADAATVGAVELGEGQLDVIVANNVLEHVADLPQLMTQALQLLRVGGQLQIEVPYEHAPTAWQDPTHVRAMNENSWIYYCGWFWYLGWFEHRFAVQTSCYLDLELRAAPRERAAFMRVTLEKVVTTPRERMVALTMSASLEVPDDTLDAAWLYRGSASDPAAPAGAPAILQAQLA